MTAPRQHNGHDAAASALTESQIERLEKLATVRGESPDDTLARVGHDAVADLPASIPSKALDCASLTIVEAGVDGDTPFIRLDSGRVFYGHPAPGSYRRLYRALHDRLPAALTESTYHLAMEVRSRYVNAHYRDLPTSGQTVIEAGAYIGLKAIGFADRVGPTGRVVAIEMMPDNVELMRRNVTANTLDEVIAVESCGLWNTPGTTTAAGQSRQKNSLVQIDERSYSNEVQVPTDTLDNILDRHDVDRVDLLNMQINGAELEALRGLERRLDSVHLMRIASYYTRDGVQTCDACCAMLAEMDCVVLNRSAVGSIYASPRRHAAAFDGLFDD